MQNSKISYRRVFVLAGLVALVLIYFFLWVRTFEDPAQRTGSDFITFYTAGRMALHGDLSHIFDPQVQRAVEESVLGFQIQPSGLAPFVHPPFLVPVFAVLAHFDYSVAFVLWSVLLALLCGLVAWYAARLFPPATGRERTILFAGTALFFPLFISIIDGQDTVLLLFGAVLWAYGLFSDDDRLAGCGLALTTIRPQIAVFLALPFLFQRRKVWGWFCAAAVVLALFSVALVGVKGLQGFINILLISAGGMGYKINEPAMVNLIGLLRRSAPALSEQSIRLAGWGGFGVGLVTACFLWFKSGRLEEKHLGTAVILAMFLSPHLHFHDLALLLLPIYGVMRTFWADGLLQRENLILLPLVFTFVLLIGFMTHPVGLLLVYLVMSVLVLMLWFPERAAFWRIRAE